MSDVFELDSQAAPSPEAPPDYICEDGHHVIAPPSDPNHPCQTPSKRRPGQLCGKPLYPYGFVGETGQGPGKP